MGFPIKARGDNGENKLSIPLELSATDLHFCGILLSHLKSQDKSTTYATTTHTNSCCLTCNAKYFATAFLEVFFLLFPLVSVSVTVWQMFFRHFSYSLPMKHPIRPTNKTCYVLSFMQLINPFVTWSSRIT